LAKLLENHGIIVELFADDVKVYLEIVNATDTEKLQGTLDLIVEWASVWQLQLFVSKCNMLTIGHVPFDVKYLVHDSVTMCQNYSQDLAIVIAQDLSLSTHISEITAKAHQRANCILRCFVSKDINLLLCASDCRILFNSLVP